MCWLRSLMSASVKIEQDIRKDADVGQYYRNAESF